MRPNMMPTVGSAQLDNQNALSDLKDDARGLLRSAKEKIEMDSVGSVLEKVTGGSGKGKTSSDLEGIAALFTAAQGGANQTMGNAVNILTALLARKDAQRENGNTRSMNLDELIELKKLEIIGGLGGNQGNQGFGQTEVLITAMTTMFKMFSDQKDNQYATVIRHLEEKVDEWKERASYQSPHAQQLEHLSHQWISQAVANSNKSPLAHLVELKQAAEELGDFNPFQRRNDPSGVTPEERMFNRKIDAQIEQVRTEDRRHRREHFVRHNAPLQWGKGIGQFAAQFAGNNAQMSQDSTLAALFGGGEPEGGPMMEGGDMP